jgi:hypothetical protein
MFCSCCKGSLTFQEMHHVKPKLSDLRATPNTKAREFKVVAAAACWGLLNCREFSGLGSDKESISAVFKVDSVKNGLFSSSGLVSPIRSGTGKRCSMTPSSSSRVCERSSSNRALRHKKHSVRRRTHSRCSEVGANAGKIGWCAISVGCDGERRARAMHDAFGTAELAHWILTVKAKRICFHAHQARL